VHGYDGDRLELRALLEPNINIYGVAFGGSIYSMCALSGWGLLVMGLQEQGLDPRIMITGGEIEYVKPVKQTINAVSSFSSEKNFPTFADTCRDKRKARIKVPVQVELDDGTLAAQFVGSYIAFPRERRPVKNAD
jgi:thioesterase domain-containing protein